MSYKSKLLLMCVLMMVTVVYPLWLSIWTRYSETEDGTFNTLCIVMTIAVLWVPISERFTRPYRQ